MRLAVAATPDVAIPTLEFLLSSSHSLERIFTTEDKPVGRGRTLTPSDVANWADSQAVPCIKIGKAEQMAAHLEDIDCVVTVAFGILLPPQILSIPKHGFINLHFSHLPSWRGAAPVQRAIEAGDENLGISVFALDEGMDTGPIYVQSSYPRDPIARSKEALDFLAKQGVALIEKTLEDISNGVAPVRQSESGISLARKLTKTEALIDWRLSADVIDRKIAAFYPNPIAFTTFRGEILKITRSRVYNGDSAGLVLRPGEILSEKSHLLIGTAEKVIEILQLIPQGKSEMQATDWARGARIVPGEICG